MSIQYPEYMPPHLRYRYCPMCSAFLVEFHDEYGHLRGKCETCGWIYRPPNVVAANTVIETSDGVVFLLPPDAPAETPAILPGGVVEFGETPEDAAAREAREETGLDVEIVRYLDRGFVRETRVGPVYAFTFLARATGGSLRDSPEGRVVVCRQDDFPRLPPHLKGSIGALATYLDTWRAGSG
jgi:ADP-ribose pyrophosphatase YjhB (NUDIX family)